MSAPQLILPRVEVVLADGAVHVVQVRNADLIRWDRTAARHGWPHFETAKALHSTFLAWSALRRDGLIGSDVTFETFSDELCLQVQAAAPVEGNGAEPESVHPIQSDPEPG